MTLHPSGRKEKIPAERGLTKPALMQSLWLFESASDGSSLVVGINVSLHRMPEDLQLEQSVVCSINTFAYQHFSPFCACA
jgi:hypothetical protein